MKVALVVLSVRGAMGQYVEMLVEALSRKANVHFFVPTHYKGSYGEAQIHRFSTGDSQIRALPRFLNPFLARRIWQEIVSSGPEVVHLFNGEGYPWALLWARWARNSGVSFVATVHDPVYRVGANKWETVNSWLRRFVLAKCSGIHVHNSSFTKDVIAQGAEAERIVVIPHGSLAPYFLKHYQQDVRREPLVLFLGRIEPYKGVELLAQVAIKLAGEFRFCISGPGKIPSKLERYMKNRPDLFEVNNRYLEDAEVTRLFQRAMVCVLPYHQASQSSLPLISAAFGVPVVATSVGSFVDDVSRVNGTLIPPGNVDALLSGILEATKKEPYYPQELDFNALAVKYLRAYGELG